MWHFLYIDKSTTVEIIRNYSSSYCMNKLPESTTVEIIRNYSSIFYLTWLMDLQQ